MGNPEAANVSTPYGKLAPELLFNTSGSLMKGTDGYRWRTRSNVEAALRAKGLNIDFDAVLRLGVLKSVV